MNLLTKPRELHIAGFVLLFAEVVALAFVHHSLLAIDSADLQSITDFEILIGPHNDPMNFAIWELGQCEVDPEARHRMQDRLGQFQDHHLYCL